MNIYYSSTSTATIVTAQFNFFTIAMATLSKFFIVLPNKHGVFDV